MIKVLGRVSMGILGGGLAVLLLGKVPELQVRDAALSDKERLELTNKHRDTLAKCLFGLGGIVLVYLTWRRISATERQASAAVEATRLTEQGQVTERFSRAVAHLADEHVQVRLGGIYALERVARDSLEDHWTVMEVLTAFIRERVPVTFEAGQEGFHEDLEPPPLDVGAALTVVGRRTEAQRVSESDEQVLDLTGCDLRAARLEGAHLERARLDDSLLLGARLRRAQLSGIQACDTDWRGADLREADLAEADLTLVHFGHAQLDGACLVRADLQEAFIDDCELGKVDLTDANFRSVWLRGSDLSRVVGLKEDALHTCRWNESTRWPDELEDMAKRVLAGKAEGSREDD
ncbi:MAG: pentapeptide repeat-containing protein [Acidobacteriota bacterium]